MPVFAELSAAVALTPQAPGIEVVTFLCPIMIECVLGEQVVGKIMIIWAVP